MKNIKLLTTLLFIFHYNSLVAQQQNFDTIIKKDGTTIQGKIIKVTDKYIEIDPKGDIPFLNLSRNEVESLIYSNGTLVKLAAQQITKDTDVIKSGIGKVVDTNNYAIGEFVFNELKGTASTLYWDSYNYYFDEVIFYSEGSRIEYKIRPRGVFTVATSQGSLFGKDNPSILVKDYYLYVDIIKEGNVVYTYKHYISNFEFELSRSLIQGNEKIIKNKKIPEYEKSTDSFSFGGVTFIPQMRFYEGVFVWETGTRIGEAYQTFKYLIKISLK